jgi:hypothetical protein
MIENSAPRRIRRSSPPPSGTCAVSSRVQGITERYSALWTAYRAGFFAKGLLAGLPVPCAALYGETPAFGFNLFAFGFLLFPFDMAIPPWGQTIRRGESALEHRCAAEGHADLGWAPKSGALSTMLSAQCCRPLSGSCDHVLSSQEDGWTD